MERQYPIQISTDLWASGCLPLLLEREIATVERRLGERFLSSELVDGVAEYLAQLKSVHAAVTLARQVRP